ncbi:hypothetical protein [Promicromonospora sukumoe]|uniref:Uncharacterized protein n=1 Tax=Promicromonospora sukumoe TaxID=88382 RepID=A0A7W3JAG4_9MICO|nr:hypothetical protein [Promicromonospora sukumoe]MBA8809251.1 hypothetical protein [Promicromonospora sukumoe]
MDQPVGHSGYLVASLDEPRFGLPEEYARAAAGGLIAGLLDSEQLPAGDLLITSAAYGDASSSEAHFELLGRIIMKLMLLRGESERDVREVVLQELDRG